MTRQTKESLLGSFELMTVFDIPKFPSSFPDHLMSRPVFQTDDLWQNLLSWSSAESSGVQDEREEIVGVLCEYFIIIRIADWGVGGHE